MTLNFKYHEKIINTLEGTINRQMVIPDKGDLVVVGDTEYKVSYHKFDYNLSTVDVILDPVARKIEVSNGGL